MEQGIKTERVIIRKNGSPYTGGNKKLPFLEKKVMVYATVKRKHHAEFQAIVTELAQKYR